MSRPVTSPAVRLCFALPSSKFLVRPITAFTPTQISGLKVWLDASDSGTVALSGSKVTTWQDKSGNLNHATQGTDANRPTFVSEAGRSFVRFTAASSQYMTIAHVAGLSTGLDVTAFVALRINTTGNQAGILVKGSSAVAFNYGIGNGLSNHIECWHNGGTPASATTTTTGVFHVVSTTQINGADPFFRTDSVQDTVVSANAFSGSSQPLWVGCRGVALDTPGNYTNSDILEMLLYFGTLSLGTKYEIERYLAAKYLIPVG